MKRKAALAALAVVPLILVGCNKTTTPHQPPAAVTQNEAKAQAIVQNCATKANFLTSAGRHNFVTCIAPPGKEAQTQKCVLAGITKYGVLTKAARKNSENAAANCVVSK